MRETLYISAAGGSGQGVLEVFECPRKVLYRRQGWKYRAKPSYFWFGSRIHLHAFRPYLTPNEADNLPERARQDVERICKSGMYSYKFQPAEQEQEVEVQENAEVTPEDVASLPDIASLQMDVWQERLYDPDRVIACEKLQVAEPRDPSTGEMPHEAEELNFRIVRRSDLLLGDGKVDAIRDLKTAKGPLTDIAIKEFGYHLQLSTDRYVNSALGNPDVADIGFFLLTKHKKRETIAKYAVDMPLERALPFHQVFEIYMQAARLLRQCEDTEAWPQNYASCEGRFSPCIFQALCFPEKWGTQEELEKHIRELLVRRS